MDLNILPAVGLLLVVLFSIPGHDSDKKASPVKYKRDLRYASRQPSKFPKTLFVDGITVKRKIMVLKLKKCLKIQT